MSASRGQTSKLHRKKAMQIMTYRFAAEITEVADIFAKSIRNLRSFASVHVPG